MIKQYNYFLICLLSCVSAGLATHEEDQKYFSEFHNRLKDTYKGGAWDWDERKTETYFTKVDNPQRAPVAQPKADVRFSVWIGNDRAEQIERENKFKVQKSPFTVDLSQIQANESNLDEVKKAIKVYYNQSLFSVEWKEETKKVPYLNQSESYETFLGAVQNGFWHKKLVLSGESSPTREIREARKFKVEVEYNQEHPLVVRGMAVSFNKERHKTGIFFDLRDGESQQEVEIKCPDSHKIELIDHGEANSTDNNLVWSRVYDGRIKRLPTRKLTYPLFAENSPWVPGGMQFMKAKGEATYIQLPIQYEIVEANENEEIRENNHFIQTLIPQNTSYCLRLTDPQPIDSDYLYSDGHGKFYITTCLQEEWQEISSNNKVQVKYLVRSPVELKFLPDVKLAKICTWYPGIYRSIQSGEGRETWKLEAPLTFENTLLFKHDERFLFPQISLQDAEAASIIKRFTPLRNIKLVNPIALVNLNFLRCVREYSQKLTSLTLSRVNLENPISWTQILEEVGHLTQLTSLNVSSNGFKSHLIQSLKQNLEKLTLLQALEIQGQKFDSDYLSLCDFRGLYAFLAEKGRTLQTLHIDNLPGEMVLRQTNDVPLNSQVFNFQKSLEIAANFILGLPSITSLNLYQKTGSDFYEHRKPEDFERILRSKAVNSGNNLQIQRREL